MSDAPRTSTLDERIEDARAHSKPSLFRRQLATKYAIHQDPTCNKYRKDLVDLIQPLEEALPTLSQYAILPKPEELQEPGKPPSDPVLKASSLPRCEVALHNPALILTNEFYRDIYAARFRNEPMPGCWDELDDLGYDSLLMAVENISTIWAGGKDATPHDLAKNLLVYAVLSDDELRARALDACQEFLDANLCDIRPLQKWRAHSE